MMKCTIMSICILLLVMMLVPPAVKVIKSTEGCSIMAINVCSKYQGLIHGKQTAGVVPALVVVCYFCQIEPLNFNEAPFIHLILPKGLDHPPMH